MIGIDWFISKLLLVQGSGTIWSTKEKWTFQSWPQGGTVTTASWYSLRMDQDKEKGLISLNARYAMESPENFQIFNSQSFVETTVFFIIWWANRVESPPFPLPLPIVYLFKKYLSVKKWAVKSKILTLMGLIFCDHPLSQLKTLWIDPRVPLLLHVTSEAIVFRLPQAESNHRFIFLFSMLKNHQ